VTGLDGTRSGDPLVMEPEDLFAAALETHVEEAEAGLPESDEVFGRLAKDIIRTGVYTHPLQVRKQGIGLLSDLDEGVCFHDKGIGIEEEDPLDTPSVQPTCLFKILNDIRYRPHPETLRGQDLLKDP